MSNAVAMRLPQRSARPRLAPTEKSRLLVIKSPAAERGLVGWLISYVAVLLIGLMGVLGINMMMASTAFDLHEAETQIISLTEEHETLREAVLVESSPQKIEERARRAGMVPAKQVAIINIKQQNVSFPNLKN